MQRSDYHFWYRTPFWRTLRITQLTKNPKCKFCGAEANTVDHVIPHRGNFTIFADQSNLQSLCHSCHSRHKAIVDHAIAKEQKQLKGYEVDKDGWLVRAKPSKKGHHVVER